MYRTPTIAVTKRTNPPLRAPPREEITARLATVNLLILVRQMQSFPLSTPLDIIRYGFQGAKSADQCGTTLI